MDSTYTKKNSLRMRCYVNISEGLSCCSFNEIVLGGKEQDAGMVNVSGKSINA